MDAAERRRRADRIFSRALDLEPGDRLTFIHDRCGDDQELLADVIALVASAEASEDYFEGRGDALVGRVWDRVARDRKVDHLVGQRLGPYDLEERVARGGMGSVYRGRRADGHFESIVAVKVLRKGMDTEDVIRRFRAERKILAGLEHPRIARILDAGETPDGRPYFAMEWVPGEAILEYCAARSLPLDARLDLFRQVCEAVAWAHRHLVVHRDLKSSNILVTEGPSKGAGAPAVKLLDFGIAKVIEGGDASESSIRTHTGQRLLTPLWASPEQVASQPVTTASDVYQLGLLLYELLSGDRPYLDDTGTPLDGPALEQAIRTLDPVPPSRRVMRSDPDDPGTRARSAALRGDLDAIVRKAMRKDPEDRYASVLALAADLRAYREGRPVGASVGTRTYRFRKFVGRHRAAVVAGTAGALLLTGWAATASWQNRALAEERDRVRAEARRTAAIRDFLVEMFQVADPFQPDPLAGDSTSARELLDAGARRLSTELVDDPGARAELAFTIGTTYRALSLDQPAREMLEQALALQAAESGPESPQVARILFELGQSLRSVEADSAAVLMERALEIEEARDDGDDLFTAQVLTSLGEHLGFTTAPDTLRSRQLRERAVELLRAHPDPPPDQMADALTISVYGLNDRPELVIERMTEALDIRRELYGDRHPAVASSLNDLSLALEATEPQRADSMMQAALEIFLATLGEAHQTTLDAMGNLASHYRDIRQDYPAAAALYRRNVALVEEHRPDDRLALAYPLYGWAVTSMRMDDFAAAEPRLRRAHELLVAELGWGNGLSFVTRYTLGECLREQERLADAAALLEESRAGFGRAPWLRVTHKLATLRELRRVYEAQGRRGDVAAVDAEIDALTEG
ncbi:MAG: serine/threonine protein kinase [Gemmatimonadetes bacterium]|nr:serine/threonine protein kinase [Gemmatimonadota bacterium]